MRSAMGQSLSSLKSMLAQKLNWGDQYLMIRLYAFLSNKSLRIMSKTIG